MEDEVDLRGKIDVFGDILFDEFKVFVPGEMLDVRGGSGKKVIDSDDVVTMGEQFFREMTAEEACSSCDD